MSVINFKFIPYPAIKTTYVKLFAIHAPSLASQTGLAAKFIVPLSVHLVPLFF